MADNFNPDWSLLEATQASLREHMRMAKVLLTQLQDLRDAAAKVMGDHPEIRAADAVIAHYVHPSVLEARSRDVATAAPAAWLDPDTGGVCSDAQKKFPHNDSRRFTVPLYRTGGVDSSRGGQS